MKHLFLGSLCCFFLLSHIFSVATAQSTGKIDKTALKSQTTGITVSPVLDSPKFPDAQLIMKSPEDNFFINSQHVLFSYQVKNYQLTEQTPGVEAKHCANSDQGQHIHLILNNQPYLAKYDTQFVQELQDGHYIALSFLSRSYHESLKNKGAYILRQFTVGNVKPETVDLSGPLLFYSRPKGEYKGKDTEKILLDFYLVNTKLSKAGNKVKATINGQIFILDQWMPYMVEGLPMGSNIFKLELIDQNGKLIPGLYNSVERKILLTKE